MQLGPSCLGPPACCFSALECQLEGCAQLAMQQSTNECLLLYKRPQRHTQLTRVFQAARGYGTAGAATKCSTSSGCATSHSAAACLATNAACRAPSAVGALALQAYAPSAAGHTCCIVAAPAAS
jgi:hypothetical protein